jgi:hypothetical protein
MLTVLAGASTANSFNMNSSLYITVFSLPQCYFFVFSSTIYFLFKLFCVSVLVCSLQFLHLILVRGFRMSKVTMRKILQLFIYISCVALSCVGHDTLSYLFI